MFRIQHGPDEAINAGPVSGPVLTSRVHSTHGKARLLTVCQLASCPWQQAAFYVPTQSPPPVWSLKAPLGLCREGLLGG